MRHWRYTIGLGTLVIAVVALGGGVSAASLGLPDSAGQMKSSTQAKIQNAMSAAPRSISEHATILDYTMDSKGHFDVLRQGTNDWSCFPDLPSTPGDDPSCNDKNWMIWTYALFSGSTEPVPLTGPGIAYMLRGGYDPSNTDPFALEPAPGESWIVTGPHIMLIEPSKPGLPGGLDPNYFSTDPKAGQFIMWAGTPYAHLHIPTTDQKR